MAPCSIFALGLVLFSLSPPRPWLSTASPRATSSSRRLLFGKHIGFNYSAIASSFYGPHWRNLRHISTVEILSSFRVQSLSAIRAQEVGSLLRGLFRDWEAGKYKAEMKSKFSELSFNIIMGMIADKRYYGENVVDLEEAERFRWVVKESLALGGASNLADFVPVLGLIDFGGVEKRMIRLVKERGEFLQGLIDEQLRKRQKMMKFLLWETRGGA